ncbi:uncharacterized, partial [Tachysurus ichikawai]
HGEKTAAYGRAADSPVRQEDEELSILCEKKERERWLLRALKRRV